MNLEVLQIVMLLSILGTLVSHIWALTYPGVQDNVEAIIWLDYIIRWKVDFIKFGLITLTPGEIEYLFGSLYTEQIYNLAQIFVLVLTYYS